MLSDHLKMLKNVWNTAWRKWRVILAICFILKLHTVVQIIFCLFRGLGFVLFLNQNLNCLLILFLLKAETILTCLTSHGSCLLYFVSYLILVNINVFNQMWYTYIVVITKSVFFCLFGFFCCYTGKDSLPATIVSHLTVYGNILSDMDS